MTSESGASTVPSDWLHDGRILGMYFRPKAMAHAPRLLVVHHTGGEGDVHALYSTLVNRGLSVHFFIDAAGEVYQLADMHSHCSHASEVNDFAIGVEMASRGVPPAMPPHKDREVYGDIARGKPCKFLDFYDVQKQAFFKLADYVTTQNPQIARKLPMAGAGRIEVLRHAIPHELLFAPQFPFSGVCGHCHVPSVSGKIDPGPRILDELAMYWGLITPTVLHDPNP